jgi:ubiquinone/menaquinone biosynthesis C-methylase UbiE
VREDPAAAKARVRKTYNLAADHFDDPPLAFWTRAGERTIQLAGLKPGNRVLDVCCGSGATAIPAGAAVGQFGTVLGVDLADGLLQLARQKAAARGLVNIQFRAADIETMPFPASSCDAVVCQFGIFFLPYMANAVRRLWSLVAPGGALALTTWGSRVLEPGMGVFNALVVEERPDLRESLTRPWERISTPAELEQLYLEGGASKPEVVSEASVQPLADPEDFWTIVLGSGSRGTVEALGRVAADRVRTKLVARIRELDIRAVETNMLFALARKPE